MHNFVIDSILLDSRSDGSDSENERWQLKCMVWLSSILSAPEVSILTIGRSNQTKLNSTNSKVDIGYCIGKSPTLCQIVCTLFTISLTCEKVKIQV